eukprot:tig00000911_g5401.t1
MPSCRPRAPEIVVENARVYEDDPSAPPDTTRIDITAFDRPGLFILAARAIKAIGLHIRRVMVIPRAGRKRRKIFYVKKVKDADLEGIRLSVFDQVNRPPRGLEEVQQAELDPFISESLICEICLEVISTCVHVVPCLHTFDQECIERWMMTSKRCPKCRCPIKSVESAQTLQRLVSGYHERHDRSRRNSTHEDSQHSGAGSDPLNAVSPFAARSPPPAASAAAPPSSSFSSPYSSAAPRPSLRSSVRPTVAVAPAPAPDPPPELGLVFGAVVPPAPRPRFRVTRTCLVIAVAAVVSLGSAAVGIVVFLGLHA